MVRYVPAWPTGEKESSMPKHRSTAIIPAIEGRGNYRKFDDISKQARFVIRMAVACFDAGLDYSMEWRIAAGKMYGTIAVEASVIPTPKALPKAPAVRTAKSWKPSIFEAEYRLNAWRDRGGMKTGFVIEHSCGLSLVHASENGEMGMTGENVEDADIRKGWKVTHTASGRGFGLSLNFTRAAAALLMASELFDGWLKPAEEIAQDINFKIAGHAVKAKFETGYRKTQAADELRRLEAVRDTPVEVVGPVEAVETVETTAQETVRVCLLCGAEFHPHVTECAYCGLETHILSTAEIALIDINAVPDSGVGARPVPAGIMPLDSATRKVHGRIHNQITARFPPGIERSAVPCWITSSVGRGG